LLSVSPGWLLGWLARSLTFCPPFFSPKKLLARSSLPFLTSLPFSPPLYQLTHQTQQIIKLI
jgi:hypothetical protein